jgi:hypothetical protein
MYGSGGPQVGVDLLAVVPIEGESGVRLAQGQVRVLEDQFLESPAVRPHVGHQLNNFGARRGRSAG